MLRSLKRLVWVAAAVLLLIPVAARAALVYDTSSGGTEAVWVAGDDGRSARKLYTATTHAYDPSISPDGQTVVFVDEPSRYSDRLLKIPAAGGTPTVMLKSIGRGDAVAWSPDSKTIATFTGPEERQLVLVDVASGAARNVATGDFGGVSFSPSGTRIVFARSGDLFTARVSGGALKRITHIGRSEGPVWGPASIAFDRERKAPNLRAYTKADLYTVRPNGRGLRHLTKMKLSALQFGLAVVDWSADGERLLADFFTATGDDHIEAVSPITGRVRRIDRPHDLTTGYRLSKDGRTVLATGPHGVVTYPYAGGQATTLVRGGDDPDWNR